MKSKPPPSILAGKIYGQRLQQAVNNFRGFPDNTEERGEIAGLAREMVGEGFDMEPEEMEELIASHGEKLTEEDFEAIIKVAEEED